MAYGTGAWTIGGAGRVWYSSMWGGVFENFGQGFQRQHVQVEEIARLLVDCFLEILLHGGVCRKITYSPSGDIILSEGIGKPPADFGGFRYLVRCGWPLGVSVERWSVINETKENIW